MASYSRHLRTEDPSIMGGPGPIPGNPSPRGSLSARTAILPTLALIVASCSGSPTSPHEVGRLDVGVAYDVHVAGQTAFVSNNDGIVIIDVGDVHQPQRLGLIQGSSEGGVVGLSVLGDTLLTCAERLAIHQVSDPTEPVLIGQFSGRKYIRVAQKQGRYVYVSYLSGGLEIVDFQDLENPVSVGYLPFSGQVLDLFVVGDVAYVANSSRGLEVIDVSDPAAPERIGVAPGTVGAWDIHVDGSVLYLGRHGNGVSILDIGEPTDPDFLGSFDDGGEIYGVFGVGDRLYTVDLQDGVEVLDISSPGHPTLLMWDRNYHPHDVYSDGQFVYLADQDDGFVILPMELDG